jgi:GxxExxY protein
MAEKELNHPAVALRGYGGHSGLHPRIRPQLRWSNGSRGLDSTLRSVGLMGPRTDGTDKEETNTKPMSNLIHSDLSRQINGAAMAVLNELRPRLDEKLYERALVIELRERGLKVEQQKAFSVSYKDQDIGTLIPDLIINDLVIVDTKVASAFNDSHIAQMTGYLSHTGLRLGILLNFKYATLKWKRVIL